MNLYYATGSGWGHLTRSLAFLHSQNADAAQWLLLTDSTAPLPQDSPLRCLRLSSEQLRTGDWAQALAPYPIEAVYVDAFPLGIAGEWLQELQQADNRKRFYYIARRLKWAEYLKNLSKANIRPFDAAFQLEELEAAHSNWLRENAAQVLDYQLVYPPVKPAQYDSEGAPLWLIVHSQPQAEVDALCVHAAEYAERERTAAHLLLISPLPPPAPLQRRIRWLPSAEARAFFALAERIFSAAGFNTMQQLKGWQGRHEIMPFFRRFDDQFWRARSYKRLPK